MLPPIRLPSGVRDFLPRAAARRRALATRVMTVFESHGFARIITPVFECSDVLELGLGESGREKSIRFVEPGTGQIVSLRPDITPQIARVVATRMSPIASTIRLCYEGNVMRLAGDRGQHEIMQAGIEMIDPLDGTDLVARDAEILAVAAASIAASGLVETRLDIGHVAPARYILAHAPDDRLAIALGKKDRAGVRVAARALPPHIAPLAEALVSLWGPADATLDRASQLAWPDAVHASIAHLRAVLAAFATLVDPPAPRVSIDLSDLRGFDYYTGVRFAGFVGGAPDAVLRGGRYDELLGRYGQPARATGFALDLEAVAQAQRATNLVAPPRSFGVAISGPDAPTFARELRARGFRAVVAGAPANFREAMIDAHVALDREESVSTVTLAGGETQSVPRASVLAALEKASIACLS